MRWREMNVFRYSVTYSLCRIRIRTYAFIPRRRNCRLGEYVFHRSNRDNGRSPTSSNDSEDKSLASFFSQKKKKKSDCVGCRNNPHLHFSRQTSGFLGHTTASRFPNVIVLFTRFKLYFVRHVDEWRSTFVVCGFDTNSMNNTPFRVHRTQHGGRRLLAGEIGRFNCFFPELTVRRSASGSSSLVRRNVVRFTDASTESDQWVFSIIRSIVYTFYTPPSVSSPAVSTPTVRMPRDVHRLCPTRHRTKAKSP